MNRDLSNLPGEGEQPDPVAEFFARERADIRELPAGTDRWESIVVEASRPMRRSWLPYLAAAAAVVLIGGVVWGTGHGPGVDRAADPASRTSAIPTVTVTRTLDPTVVPPAPSTGASGLPSTSVPATPLPVPSSFGIVSMSNAGGGHLFALGSATCPKGPCTAVIASDDDGATWTTRASFETLTTPGARTTPDRAHQLVGIRFADERVGYVYGSTTKRTTDGGRHWVDVDVDHRTVLSLETDGSQVWMATARSCRHDVASGARGCEDLQPRTGPVTGSTTRPVVFDGMPAAGENAWVTMDGSDAYYNVSATDPSGAGAAVPAMRLTGKVGPLALPQGCRHDGGMWVSAPANTRGTLVGVCASAAQPTVEYALAVSTDKGTTWTTRAAPGLGRPTATGIWLTATDAKHLVAVRQGLPSSAGGQDAPTTLLRSADGGASWRAVPVAPSGAVAWAGAAGGPLVYALAGGGSYWVSRDSGATFDSVPLHR